MYCVICACRAWLLLELRIKRWRKVYRDSGNWIRECYRNGNESNKVPLGTEKNWKVNGNWFPGIGGNCSNQKATSADFYLRDIDVLRMPCYARHRAKLRTRYLIASRNESRDLRHLRAKSHNVTHSSERSMQVAIQLASSIPPSHTLCTHRQATLINRRRRIMYRGASREGFEGFQPHRIDAVQLNTKNVFRRSSSHFRGVCFWYLSDKISIYSDFYVHVRFHFTVKIGKTIRFSRKMTISATSSIALLVGFHCPKIGHGVNSFPKIDSPLMWDVQNTRLTFRFLDENSPSCIECEYNLLKLPGR